MWRSMCGVETNVIWCDLDDTEKQVRHLEIVEEVRIIVIRKGMTINIARILKYCGSAYVLEFVIH
jgi:hypothetical protein